MRRYSTVLAGLAAAALLPTAATAQVIDPATTQFTTGGVNITAPVDVNREVAGPLTTAVTATTPPGGFANSDALTIDLVVFIRDANGVVQDTGIINNIKAGVTANAITGDITNEPFDFSMAPLGAALKSAVDSARALVNAGVTVSGGGTAVATGIGLVINDASGNGLDTLLNVSDETLDEIIDADDAGPALTQVLRDTATMPERFIFVFDDDLTNTVLGNLTNADFESSTTMGGMFAAFTAGAFPGNPTLIGNNRALQFNIAAGQENLAPAIGDFARIALPNAGPPATNPDVIDLALNVSTDQTPQQIAAVSAPTISGATWKTSVNAGGMGTLEVQFSANLNSGAIGDLAFWQNAGASIVPSTGMTDLTVTAVAAFDPSKPDRVTLTVTSGGTDSVAADGKGDNTGGANPPVYTLSLDTAVGTPPQDFLGTAISGTPSVTVLDMIPPVAVGSPFTLDEDGDGDIDAFGQYFNEPLDSSMLASAGFTLARVSSTIHPFSTFLTNLAAGIDDPGDAMNQVTITAAGDATDEFQSQISTFGLNNQDTTGANRLQQNNCLIIRFTSSGFDWDSDPMTSLVPSTNDAGFASVAITASTSGVKDTAGNALAADLAAANATDGAGPVLARVDFSTGDNLSGGVQKPSEKDGSAGDSPNNNTAILTFNEGINAGGIDETKWRFGLTSAERFAAGDSQGVSGAGGNILQLQDSSGGGFGPGDTFTVDTANGVTDGTNAYPGTGGTGAPTLAVSDVTAPYVLLQQDINGATIHSAFLGGVDSNGFATTISMTFSTALKLGTEGLIADWSIAGVGNPTSVTLSGNVITLTFPANLISASDTVVVTYNGATAGLRIAAAGGSMGTVAVMNDTFTARSVPLPNVDGEFPAVLDIAGTINGLNGSAPVPAGTKMFGAVGVPRATTSRVTMNSVEATIEDSTSLEAITNVLLGLESDLFLLVDNEDMWFRNFKDDEGFVEQIIDVSVQATSLTQVRLTGAGSNTGAGNIASRLTGGTVTICWDVLRSSDGTAFSLFNDGFQIGGRPVVSSAVVTGDDGKYFLHMTAPIASFNGAVNAAGWPVILVVELPTGERIPVSSLLNAADGQGPILFNGLQRQSDPFNSDGNIVFNPNLANCAVEFIYKGWNVVPFGRDTGFQAKTNGVILPDGVPSSSVVTGTTLSNTNPLDQFVYFRDTNGDGVWTSADDSVSRLDGIAISIRCLDFFAFVMDSNGVKTGSNITSFVGGYAAGIFNGATGSFGAFQFGSPIVASTVFQALSGTNSFPDNTTTMGWALVTSPTTGAPGAFLTTNGSDFLIIFDRTSNTAVNISTFSAANGTSGAPEDDTATVTQGHGLFLHK